MRQDAMRTEKEYIAYKTVVVSLSQISVVYKIFVRKKWAYIRISVIFSSKPISAKWAIELVRSLARESEKAIVKLFRS